MIRLHHVPGSRSFRILWLLSEMGLTPEIKTYSIAAGDMQTPEYRRLSPAGRAPALEIDGLTLFESGAITEYLCESRPEHRLAPAAGSLERPRFLECLNFAETQANLVANLNLQYVFLRDPAMRSPVVLKIETRRLGLTMEAVENGLQGQDYMLKSGFSAADTMMGFNIEAASHFVRLDPFPCVRAYAERMKARPAYQRAAEIDGPNPFYTQEFYGPDNG